MVGMTGCRGGGRDEEEESFPQVLVPRCRPRCVGAPLLLPMTLPRRTDRDNEALGTWHWLQEEGRHFGREEGLEPDHNQPRDGEKQRHCADNESPCSLLDLGSDELRDVVHARARRKINRGLKRRPMGLIKKLRKAKQEAKPNEKPDLVKTHLRDMIVVPEMIGSVIGIYSGKEFNQVEIKPEMVGHYLGEFSIT